MRPPESAVRSFGAIGHVVMYLCSYCVIMLPAVAAHFENPAMQVKYVCAASALVQIINILGDDAHIIICFQLC